MYVSAGMSSADLRKTIRHSVVLRVVAELSPRHGSSRRTSSSSKEEEEEDVRGISRKHGDD